MNMPPYVKGVLLKKFLTGDTYRSPVCPAGAFARTLPSVKFYSGLFGSAVPWLCHRAKIGQCDDSAWVYASVWAA
ncbi:MAG: 1-acyl-sn-glycerol-3-phosphate acyltransferase, partial [Desulfovibrionaceae bacterium]|nr:1-acyl-sn-glycerol-3-phosphate acyltransferase [Desulfovibrionaceae bacterium]